MAKFVSARSKKEDVNAHALQDKDKRHYKSWIAGEAQLFADLLRKDSLFANEKGFDTYITSDANFDPKIAEKSFIKPFKYENDTEFQKISKIMNFPKGSPMVQEVYYARPDRISSDDIIITWEDWVTAFGAIRLKFMNDLEKIKTKYPVLYEVEMSNAKKCAFNIGGALDLSFVAERPTTVTNKELSEVPDEVMNFYAQHFSSFRKYIKESDTDMFAIRAGTATGLKCPSSAREIGLNLVANIISVHKGMRYVRDQPFFREQEKQWTSDVPSNAARYGIRCQVKGHPRAIGVTTFDGISPLFWTKGLTPAQRPINITSKEWEVPVKSLAKAILYMFTLDEHFVTDGEIARVKLKKMRMRNLHIRASDFSSMGTSIRKAFRRRYVDFHIRPYIPPWLVDKCMYPPLLTPARGDDHEAILVNTGEHNMPTGASHTSCENCFTHLIILLWWYFDMFKTMDKCWQWFEENAPFMIWGDDGICGFKDLKLIDSLTDFKIRLGFKPEVSEDPLYLMRLHFEGMSTNIMWRAINSVFNPERIVPNALIRTVKMAALTLLLKEHPMIDWWNDNIMNFQPEFVSANSNVNPYYLKNTPQECIDFVNSDEGKKAIFEYGISSVRNRHEIEGMAMSLTSGASPETVGTSNLIKEVLAPGLLDNEYDLEISATFFSDFELTKLYEAYNEVALAGWQGKAAVYLKTYSEKMRRYAVDYLTRKKKLMTFSNFYY